jgi:hypothetical protein
MTKENYTLIKIKQHFNKNSLSDLKGEISKEIIKLQPYIKPGSRIAIAVGSRGIKNLVLVVKEVAQYIREQNAFPFIVPAMGSHGDATAEGQQAILEGYGISEKSIGVPVLSSMEVVEMPQGESPVPVYLDKFVYESDGVILIGRVKPHTDFHSKYESGLVKMSVIGLGKEMQASAIHRFGVYGLSTLIPLAAKQLYTSGKVLGGVALVENGYDDTMLINVLTTDEFLEKEPVLLNIARKNMASLPVFDIDLLIIDRMGKDISGVGIDTNIIGRMKITGQKEPDRPFIKSIIVSDLTDESHGNAIGLGLADVITRKLYNKIDFSSTYTNAVTSSFLDRAKIPVVAGNDRDAFDIAMRSCGYLAEGEEKIIRISDTLHLDELLVSRAVMDLIKDNPAIESIVENVNLFQDETEFAPF